MKKILVTGGAGEESQLSKELATKH